MEIEIVNIGSELLGGFTVNTNAAFLCKELTHAGYTVVRQTALPDEPQALEEGLSEIMQKGRITITTGGLGPTVDDLTRKVGAKLMGCDFCYDESIANDLIERFGDRITIIRDQATVPSKAKIIKNTIGTAPGLIFDENNSVLIMLQGVPSEMREMFQKSVLPYLKKHYPPEEETVVERFHLFGLSESDVDPYLRRIQERHPELDLCIYPGLGILEVQLKCKGVRKEAEKQLSVSAHAFRKKFYSHLYASSSGTLEGAIHLHFIQNGFTLSVAESCTGGAICSRIAHIPGASEYFLGGVVSYSNASKQSILGVPKEMIDQHGAVSEEVVGEMAKRIQKLTDSDYSIAVSGIAGPTGGTEEKPIGTVWFAIAQRVGETVTWKIEGRGTREMIVQRSVNEVLSRLLVKAGGHG